MVALVEESRRVEQRVEALDRIDSARREHDPIAVQPEASASGLTIDRPEQVEVDAWRGDVDIRRVSAVELDHRRALVLA